MSWKRPGPKLGCRAVSSSRNKNKEMIGGVLWIKKIPRKEEELAVPPPNLYIFSQGQAVRCLKKRRV
jgi:hypothetical protein